MGKAQQAAGGGLTAADRAKLIPSNIRQGVTLFEGTSKEVAGSLKVLRINVASSNGTVDMKTILPNAWDTLTTDNFAFAACSSNIHSQGGYLSNGFDVTLNTSIAYNSSTGILTIGGYTSTNISGTSGAKPAVFTINRAIVCYYS